MKIRSDRIDATAILIADMSKGLYTGALEGRVNNYRIESVGIFNLETTADLDTAPNGGFTLKGRVRARSTRLLRSEEHTSELQSLMRISYAVFCLKKKT